MATIYELSARLQKLSGDFVRAISQELVENRSWDIGSGERTYREETTQAVRSALIAAASLSAGAAEFLRQIEPPPGAASHVHHHNYPAPVVRPGDLSFSYGGTGGSPDRGLPSTIAEVRK